MPYWTAEQDARLTELWAGPRLGSSQIAGEMGFESRNAIIGRVHRLNLPMRNPAGGNTFRHKGGEQTGLVQRLNSGRPLRGQFSVKIDHSKSAPPTPPPRFDFADTDIPSAQRRTILSLTNETCHWPIGDPGTPGFFFCGHASADVDGGQPYCATHAKRAFSGQGGRI